MTMRLVFSSLMIVAGLGVVGSGPPAAAQTLTPPPGATYGQPLPVPPARPLYYHPFTNYDLLYGYSRGALTAPQPIGHEHIPLGNGGYIYRPVYATPPQLPPPAVRQMRPAQAATLSRPPSRPSILQRLPPAPPPAPESVVRPELGKPNQPAGPREF
ncbi:MAG TPA: hypothetical protein VIK18_10345 [Pirellulales bacterium]